MSIRNSWHKSKARDHAANTLWPWSMLLISVALIFFHLGKTSHPTFAGHPVRRDREVRMASPIFPVPQLRKKKAVVSPKKKPAKTTKVVSRKKRDRRSPGGTTIGSASRLVRE